MASSRKTNNKGKEDIGIEEVYHILCKKENKLDNIFIATTSLLGSIVILLIVVLTLSWKQGMAIMPSLYFLSK